ncbi:DUF3558 domain-containing protein [Parasphingorhabdus pacifica]
MRTTRSATAAVLVIAGLLLSGCAGGTGDDANAPTTEPAEPSPLASFDPCGAVPPEVLQANELESAGEPVDQGIEEPGCRHRGDVLYLTVYKAEQKGLDYWEQRRSNFGVFQPNQVGERQGIQVVNTGSQGQGICNQIIEVGGGSVSVHVKYRADKIEGNDPCTKATEIAQLIEPKLPA